MYCGWRRWDALRAGQVHLYVACDHPRVPVELVCGSFPADVGRGTGEGPGARLGHCAGGDGDSGPAGVTTPESSRERGRPVTAGS